tara:strand:+ start:221 stop:598 length:378 start_codon:yes stop_codon:yes gene_type:complete
MKNKRGIILKAIIIGIIALIIILYLFGILFEFNKIIPQKLDLSCESDLDCKLHVSPDLNKCRSCALCKTFEIEDEKVIAINKDWQPSCPFPKPLVSNCGDCETTIVDKDLADLKCIKNTCQKTLN